MNEDELALRVLEVLRPEDLEILLNLNFRRAYERGDVVVADNELVDRFYLVEEGTLCMTGEPGREPRYLRRGQVFGSTSLIIQRPSPNSVTAMDDVIVLTLSQKELDWLIQAEPAVAARLMKALAAGLAARNVREPVGAGARAEAAEPRPQPSGMNRLITACREAQAALARLGPLPEEGVAYWARERIQAVATAYRPVLRAMAGVLDPATPAERPALVASVRQEVLRLAGGSRLVERMQSRPTGQAAGYRAFSHLYKNVPEGNDALGVLTDAWLLTRPFAEAIRERRTAASERLTRAVVDLARPDRFVRVLSLGCGPARSLADLLEEPGVAEKVSITCVDDDREALVYANNLLKSRAPRGDITFRQCSPHSLIPEAEGYGGYDLIASLYTADNSDIPALGRILYIAHRWLHAHGSLELVVFGDAVPDWLVMEVLLDWKPQHPNQRELEEMAARSPFGQANTQVVPTPSGLNLLLRAVK